MGMPSSAHGFEKRSYKGDAFEDLAKLLHAKAGADIQPDTLKRLFARHWDKFSHLSHAARHQLRHTDEGA